MPSKALVRRGTSMVRRWAPYAVPAARAAMRTYRNRSYNGSQRRRTVRQSTAPAPITYQRDASTVYRRRRMPMRKKRTWIRLKRNVNAVINKRLATNVLHLTDTAPMVITNADGAQQYYGGLTLLDAPVLSSVASAVDRYAPPTGSGIVTPIIQRRKWVIVGQMNNLTIKNNSTEGVAYLDLYYWRTKKNCPSAEASSIETLWTTGFQTNAYNNAGTGSSTVAATDYGMTPWANPGWREYVQVYMKRRIRLSAGQDTELSLRSSKNYYSPGNILVDNLSLIRGKTEGIFVVFAGDPHIVTPPTTTTRSRPQTLVFSRVRTLFYKVLEGSLPTAGETTS